MWKYTKVCVNPRRGNTRFHMWKFTWDRVFPHVEIHQKLWISQHAEIHIFWCISTCGNSSGKVNFRMSVYKRICEFPRGKTCGNTRFFADFRMRKYTRICEFPRAEIHAERCITACGNTLIRVYFPMRTYTFPRVFPHAEIHTIRCKSSYGFYTLPLAFPHAAIHYFRCISTSLKIHLFWRNSTCGVSPILVYFRFSGNSLFLAWFRMRLYTSHSVFPPVGNSLFRA